MEDGGADELASYRRQAAYLAEAQRLSRTGSFGWTPRTGAMVWSDETFRILGCDTAAKPVVETYLQRVHPDDLARLREVLDAAAGKTTDFDVEHRLQRPDGTIAHVRVVARAATDGPDLHFIGAVTDVTERKQAEEALRYSEHRYTNLFQAMAASFWELDFSGATTMVRALRKAGVEDFRKYFAENPGFVRDMMRATRVIDVNPMTVAIFGRGNKEELLTNVEPFWPEESTLVFAEGFLQGAERKNSHFSTECKLRRIDGSLFDALFTAAYPPETMGKGSLMVGVIDITARKQAFTELEESEQRYRYLFHYMPIGLTQIDASELVTIFKELRLQGVTDLDSYMDEHPDFLERAMEAMKVEEVNAYNLQLFGAASAEEMYGPITRYWRASPDTIRRSIAARYRGEASYQEETKVTTMDGRVVDVLFSTARPAPATNKSLVGFIDITARQQAYAALEQSELRYRNLFHYMPIPLWRMNTTRVIALMNELRAQGVTDLTAYMDANPDFLAKAMDAFSVEEVNQSAATLFGARDIKDMYVPLSRYWQHQPETLGRMLAARFRGDPAASEETEMRTFDGRIIHGTFTAAFPDVLSRLGISMNAFVDATDRVHAETMLRRVQAEFAHAARISVLGELTASIAHEVNQPLAAITTNGEAGLRRLGRADPDIAKIGELMKRMVADARRAADIIARVRNMAGRREHELTRLSLHQLIDEVLVFLGHEIQSRRVTVRLDRATAIPDVLADRTQLQQVVVNLAVNAMQAMVGSDPRVLAIRTQRTDNDQVACSVEDSGPGIDAAHLDRLFESFFTTKDGGMGMGLPICRSIIEAHGGRIQADNGSAQGGARFSFTLPAA
jgi:PAS domain S-box-containing protein